MLVFDRIRLQDLDRRNWQLWVLAVLMIIILAAALAVHMYTFASGTPYSVSRRAMLQAIVGFCALALLFVSYLIDRLRMISRLRHELLEEKKHNLERMSQSNRELLKTLSGPGRFSERLALELQKADSTKLALSGLTVSLEVSPSPSDIDEICSAFGEAVKAMMHRLRAEDSIYQFSSGVFGILLPGARQEAARSVALRVADGLNEAMGVSHRYSFDIRLTHFPDHAKTAAKMEALMRGGVRVDQPGAVA